MNRDKSFNSREPVMYKINRTEAIAILEKALDRNNPLSADKQSFFESVISGGEHQEFYHGMLSGACLMINYAHKINEQNKNDTLSDMVEVVARTANFYVD